MELEQLHIHRVQKVLLPKNLPQKQKSNANCYDHSDKIKTISWTNHRYLAPTTQLAFTCSKSTTETLEKRVKYVQC